MNSALNEEKSHPYQDLCKENLLEEQQEYKWGDRNHMHSRSKPGALPDCKPSSFQEHRRGFRRKHY